MVQQRCPVFRAENTALLFILAVSVWAFVLLGIQPHAQADVIPSIINYPAVTPVSSFTFNGDANTQGDGSLQLTSIYQNNDSSRANYNPAVNQKGSFFYNSPVNISKFTTSFRFRLAPWAGRDAGEPWADGITFAMQGQGANALGDGGSNLGYAPIPFSVALKFKTFALGDPNMNGDPSSSTVSLLTNGQDPTGSGLGLTDLLQFGQDFDLGAGATFRADVTYSMQTGRLSLTLTNQNTNKTINLSFPANIPAYVGGNSAYVGFTGGTGLFVSDQRILSWQYTPQGAANDSLRPTLNSITPASKTVGSSAFAMTLRGAGFAPNASTVRLDNTILNVTASSPTEITATVPANLLTTARTYNVTVTVSGKISNALRFDVTRTAPPVAMPSLQIIGNQISGIDDMGNRYVVFLIENQGSANITNINFDTIRLDTGSGTQTGSFDGIVPGASPGGTQYQLRPRERIQARFSFFGIGGNGVIVNGAVAIGGTSDQGRFNAGTRYVQFH